MSLAHALHFAEDCPERDLEAFLAGEAIEYVPLSEAAIYARMWALVNPLFDSPTVKRLLGYEREDAS